MEGLVSTRRTVSLSVVKERKKNRTHTDTQRSAPSIIKEGDSILIT